MWYCPNCGAPNRDGSGFCTECRLRRPGSASAKKASSGGRKRKKKKSLWWLWLLLCLAALAAAAFTCYRYVHLWAPPDCTEPETCILCGKTMGEPLGHDPISATCLEPETCRRCGEILAPALGHDPIPASCLEPERCSRCSEILSPALDHDWAAANYDRPETCQRCGETQGYPRGWVGNLSGRVDEEILTGLFGFGESHPYLLDQPVHKAFRITVMLKISSYEGDPFGDWGLYARDLTGQWELLERFTVPGPGDGAFQCFPLELDGTRSFDALSFLPMTMDDYDIGYSFYYADVQEYVD